MTRVSRSLVGVWSGSGALLAALACQKPRSVPPAKDEAVGRAEAVWCRDRARRKAIYYSSTRAPARGRAVPSRAACWRGDFEAGTPTASAGSSGHYAEGKLEGKWQQWTRPGSKVADGEYREGRLVSGAPVAVAAICETPCPHRRISAESARAGGARARSAEAHLLGHGAPPAPSGAPCPARARPSKPSQTHSSCARLASSCTASGTASSSAAHHLDRLRVARRSAPAVRDQRAEQVRESGSQAGATARPAPPLIRGQLERAGGSRGRQPWRHRQAGQQREARSARAARRAGPSSVRLCVPLGTRRASAPWARRLVGKRLGSRRCAGGSTRPGRCSLAGLSAACLGRCDGEAGQAGALRWPAPRRARPARPGPPPPPRGRGWCGAGSRGGTRRRRCPAPGMLLRASARRSSTSSVGGLPPSAFHRSSA